MPYNDTLRAGDLRRRVTLQNTVETADTFGAAGAEAWVTLATVWADVIPMSGRELQMAQQIESQIDTRIRIRYLEGLKARARATEATLTGTVVYDIQAVIPDSRRVFIDLHCIRRNA